MTFKVAIQMDSIESINIKSDTTFVIALEAQRRGHILYYYNPSDLFLENGDIYAFVQKIVLKEKSDNYFQLSKTERIDLSEMDVVLMRQDPPFNMDYLTYTYFLDKISESVFVVNNPTEVRNCPEKLFVTDFKEFTPKTVISRNLQAILEFKVTHEQIILKPLYAHGGIDVFKISNDLEDKFEYLVNKYNTPIIAQEFIKNVDKGDKRIILIDGEYVGAVNRIPENNSILSNFVQGGSGEKTSLTDREKEICAALKNPLKERNLFLAGIDVIDGYLTEINVTSPTGFRSINDLNGSNIEKIFWDKLEDKLSI